MKAVPVIRGGFFRNCVLFGGVFAFFWGQEDITQEFL